SCSFRPREPGAGNINTGTMAGGDTRNLEETRPPGTLRRVTPEVPPSSSLDATVERAHILLLMKSLKDFTRKEDVEIWVKNFKMVAELTIMPPSQQVVHLGSFLMKREAGAFYSALSEAERRDPKTVLEKLLFRFRSEHDTLYWTRRMNSLWFDPN